MSDEVVVTGIGHVSCIGSNLDEVQANLLAFSEIGGPVETLSEDLFEGLKYLTFRAPEIEVSKFGVPRRENRFLGPMMRLAIAASYDALVHAGLIGRHDLLSELDLIIACGAGVRDQDTDLGIARELASGANAELGALLAGHLRPTEFLCQLPNLTAANICSFFGITGANRTLMGGATAGLHALHMAHRKITSGQADRVLVGGAGFGQCYYTNLALAQAGLLARSSQETARTALGSASSFFVLESRIVAEERSVRWHEVVAAPSMPGSKPDQSGDDQTTPVAHARIANLMEHPASSGAASDVLDVTALIGNTREDAVFDGMVLAIAAMRNRELSRGLVSMQHPSGTQSCVVLSAGELQ